MKRESIRYFRRRGVRQLRSLINLADPAAESPGESWTRLEILDSNLPAPQVQWWITRNGRRLYRLDLAYPGMKICVEYDGEEFHDSPEAREVDAGAPLVASRARLDRDRGDQGRLLAGRPTPMD